MYKFQQIDAPTQLWLCGQQSNLCARSDYSKDAPSLAGIALGLEDYLVLGFGLALEFVDSDFELELGFKDYIDYCYFAVHAELGCDVDRCVEDYD